MSAGLDPAAVAAADPGGMSALIASWPEQLERQRAALAERPWPPPPRRPRLLAIGGLGGSAIAGDLVAGLSADDLPAPTAVTRDYRWPAAVGPETLCVLSSYSGDTEETLALYEDAGARGAMRVALSSGGALAARAESDGVPWRGLPAGLPPRAALGYSLVSLLCLYRTLGWPGADDEALDEAISTLREGNRRWGPERPAPENRAKRLALALRGRCAVLYAAERPLAGVARRWKGQLNENAKLPAFHATLPELNHNEIVGWEGASALRPHVRVVFLRDREEHPRVARRVELTRELLAEDGIECEEVGSTGEGRLARTLSLVQLGDWTSLYLAVLERQDPMRIEKLERLKRLLEKST